MASREREYAEQRMQQHWHHLVMAEQQGASPTTLERLYQTYIRSVEEFNCCCAPDAQQQPQAAPVPARSPYPTTTNSTTRTTHRRKKAS